MAKIFISVVFLLMILASGCKSDSSQANERIATDVTSISKGKVLFNQYCSACHNFNFDGIGPKLGGITDSVTLSWLKDFIRNPKQQIDGADARATRLFTKFKTIMPAFQSLADSSLNNILAYIHTRKPIVLSNIYSDREEVKDPIPDTIEMSDLIVELKLITQFPTTGTPGVAPLARITKLDFAPHSGQVFVLDMNGILYKLINDEPVVYMDISKLMNRFIPQPGLSSGFANFAFHPDFQSNGLLFTAHTEPADTKKADFAFEDTLESALQFVISEWKVDHQDLAKFEGQ